MGFCITRCLTWVYTTFQSDSTINQWLVNKEVYGVCNTMREKFNLTVATKVIFVTPNDGTQTTDCSYTKCVCTEEKDSWGGAYVI